VRSPDVSFVAAGRFPDERWPHRVRTARTGPGGGGVVSQRQQPRRVEKVGEYLDAGTRVVWVIDPEKRTAALYRRMTDLRVIGEADTLEGEDVATGFVCPLANILG
jgi:hypothetical protein